MLKNLSRLESVIGDKVGHFFVDNDTPISVVKEMMFQFLKYIGQIEDQIKASQEEKVSSEEKKSETEEPKTE